jgi:hypothetical protein
MAVRRYSRRLRPIFHASSEAAAKFHTAVMRTPTAPAIYHSMPIPARNPVVSTFAAAPTEHAAFSYAPLF